MNDVNTEVESWVLSKETWLESVIGYTCPQVADPEVLLSELLRRQRIVMSCYMRKHFSGLQVCYSEVHIYTG